MISSSELLALRLRSRQLCAHEDLLKRVLKEEFGMSGSVISDGNGVSDIFHQPAAQGNGAPGHQYAKSWEAAAADALRAGCDQSWDEDEVPGMRYGDPANGTLVRALAANLITMEDVRKAATNTLLPRFRVGLYDPPGSSPWDEIPASVIQSADHVKLALQAATETQTLLKNTNGTLPLRSVAHGGPAVIAVIGAAANSSRLSIDRYSGSPSPENIVMFTEGIRARAAAAGATVVACQSVMQPTACAAKLQAAGADFVVMVSTGDAEGEQHDRATLGLAASELALLAAVRSTLPPAVKVTLTIVSGGAVSTEQAEPMVDATLWSGKAGMQAGAGFAALLYGDQDASGRVAATIYKEAWVSASSFLDSAISGVAQPRGYRYNPRAGLVMYRFGHGLSYNTYSTSLDKGVYTVSAADLQHGGNITVTATVTSSGSIAAVPIRSVLLFLSRPQRQANAGRTAAEAAGLPARIEWLGAFAKARGATAAVKLVLSLDALARWVPTGGATSTSFVDGAYTVEPGNYVLRVTDSSTTATLTVTP